MNVHPTVKKVARHPATWLGICVTLVAGYEGFSSRPYQDVVGVWTQCYGETRGITRRSPDMSKPACQHLLALRLPQYHDEVMRCVHVPVSPYKEAAITSAAYNLGSRTVCHSEFVRHLNEGDPNACKYLLHLNHAGGRVVRGLTLRREDEIKWCEKE